MPETPERKFRREIERLLAAAGWQVLEYFDAYLIGLTATPNK